MQKFDAAACHLGGVKLLPDRLLALGSQIHSKFRVQQKSLQAGCQFRCIVCNPSF